MGHVSERWKFGDKVSNEKCRILGKYRRKTDLLMDWIRRMRGQRGLKVPILDHCKDNLSFALVGKTGEGLGLGGR